MSQQAVRFPMTIIERLTFQELKIELIFTENEGDQQIAEIKLVLKKKYRMFLDGKSNFPTANVSQTYIPGIYKTIPYNKLTFQHKRTEDYLTKKA